MHHRGQKAKPGRVQKNKKVTAAEKLNKV